MIKKYTLKALQKAINHALALDEFMGDKLSALENKVLEIIITPLQVNFFILFSDKQLKLLAEYDGPPDTIIHSSPLGLIRLSFLPASQARSLFNDKIKLSGDVELGNHVKQLFDELDIDWEGHLAHFTGDVIAHQVSSFFRKSLAFKKQLSSSLRHSVSNYLQEELRLLPPSEEIKDFLNDVDSLSLEVERIQAHINQLKSKNEVN